MEKEIWKPVKGYEGLYEISDLGNVKSLSRLSNNRFNSYMTKEKLLKPTIEVWGYKVVRLTKNKNEQDYKVHRLVAEAFIPNPENKPQVNHIDGNKLNNCVDNLEWCTCKENINHCWNTGNHKKYKGIEHPRSKQILQYDLQGNFIKEWDTMTEISKELKIGLSTICFCCQGKFKTAGGYIFKYSKEE